MIWSARYGKRWLALKLMENDQEIIKMGHGSRSAGGRTGEPRTLSAIFGDDARDHHRRPPLRFHLRRLPGDRAETATELRHDCRTRSTPS